ncbi:hypothetical protein T440DRAFT_383421 [Plenodomus tracheiphilus IPT5]|uniref:Uncharacterized protein n=1 Tax=Plenodomus tracheiphilus IPT5 TaxID=1408161 RepID=A0A6A7BNH3_9PLEO|nr:hypothetical protein T440DRAFT_383421 [Plenodomus tracheiphilus IPT5]
MTEYASDLYPYSLEKAIKADCGEHDRDCFVVDVGHNEFGVQVDSLQHLINVVECHQSNTEELRPIRKLYIIGAWRLTPSKEECEGFGEETKRHEGEPHLFTKQEEEWHEAGKNIAKFVALMPKLEELTWISSLPFTAWVWEGLSLSMTKIIIDIGFPVRLQVNGFDDIYKSYITCKELKPLIQQTKLEELRLFHMQDSYQNIIWETVYRNTNEDGMRLLDLTMAEPPLVRPKHWQKANDVAGLTVAIAEACGKEYK